MREMAVAVKTNEYKTSLINNRRYLGNKYKLLPFITGVVNDECPDITSIADIFAGTGAVSSAFTDKVIITNDLMYSNCGMFETAYRWKHQIHSQKGSWGM